MTMDSYGNNQNNGHNPRERFGGLRFADCLIQITAYFSKM